MATRSTHTNISFKPSHPLWDEMALLVEYCALRWFLGNEFTKLLGKTQIYGIRVPCVVLHEAGRLLHCGVDGKEIKFTEVIPETLQPAVLRANFHNLTSCIRVQQIVFGHAFEKIRVMAQKKYGPRRSWPSLLEFAYHIRNGSFHGNRFNFTKRIFGLPAWRGVVIDASLQGALVMGSVLGFGDLPILLHELWSTV